MRAWAAIFVAVVTTVVGFGAIKAVKNLTDFHKTQIERVLSE